MPPVDLTSTWIPLSLLAVLCTYMFVLFQRERRMAHAFEAEGGEAAPAATIPASATMAGEAAAAAVEAEDKAEAPAAEAAPAHVEPAHAAAPAAEAPAKSKKRRLLWRTAFIWLPFLVGFGWQAYLDFFKAMLEKAAN